MFEPIPDRTGAWSLPERLFRTAVVGAAENPQRRPALNTQTADFSPISVDKGAKIRLN
jgi:hypothetical protein